MSAFDLQEVLAFAIDLSKTAGKIIVEGSEKRFKAQDEGKSDYEDIIKKNTADLVTEYDQKTEALVKEEISRKYPSHKFIGEESWAAGEETKLGNEPHWIVDPIDGTTNFVRGITSCCISIGITFEARPVIGVVFAPFTGYLYWASEGHGAWLETPTHTQKRQLPLSRSLPFPSLKQAVMGLEWGSDRRAETIAKKVASFGKLAGDPEAGVEGGQMVSGIRSFGSAALSCCAVAEGSLDFWHEIGCWVSGNRCSLSSSTISLTYVFFRPRHGTSVQAL
jgi:myo-inositol-1(or 4)-monophosphatase